MFHESQQDQILAFTQISTFLPHAGIQSLLTFSHFPHYTFPDSLCFKLSSLLAPFPPPNSLRPWPWTQPDASLIPPHCLCHSLDIISSKKPSWPFHKTGLADPSLASLSNSTTHFKVFSAVHYNWVCLLICIPCWTVNSTGAETIFLTTVFPVQAQNL